MEPDVTTWRDTEERLRLERDASVRVSCGYDRRGRLSYPKDTA